MLRKLSVATLVLASLCSITAQAQETVRLGNLKFAHYGAVSYIKEIAPTCGIKVDEAEGALKRNGKLGMTQNLTANPHAQKFVLEQIEQVEVWVKEIQKEDAAKKQSAA